MKLLRLVSLTFILTIQLFAEDRASPVSAAWNRAIEQAQLERSQGRYVDAEATAKDALRIAKTFGRLDLRVADAYDLLGEIFRESMRCPEARASYVRAISVLRQQSRLDPQYLFNVVTDLIAGLCECGQFGAAVKEFHAYQPELRRLRGDPLNEAKILSLEAALAWGRKDFKRVEICLRQAIRLQSNWPRPVPVEVAENRDTLSTALSQQGRYAESLAEAESAIALLEKHAPRSRTRVYSINNAACALAHLGRYQESEAMIQRALALAVDLFGDDNRTSAIIMLNYAEILRKSKRSEAAADWRTRGTETLHRSSLRETATVDVQAVRDPPR